MDFIKEIMIVGTEESAELLDGIMPILEEDDLDKRAIYLGQLLSKISKMEREKDLDVKIGSFLMHMCITVASVEGTYEDRKDAAKNYLVAEVTPLIDDLVADKAPELEKKIGVMLDNLFKNKTKLLFEGDEDDPDIDAIYEEVSNDA